MNKIPVDRDLLRTLTMDSLLITDAFLNQHDTAVLVVDDPQGFALILAWVPY